MLKATETKVSIQGDLEGNQLVISEREEVQWLGRTIRRRVGYGAAAVEGLLFTAMMIPGNISGNQPLQFVAFGIGVLSLTTFLAAIFCCPPKVKDADITSD